MKTETPREVAERIVREGLDFLPGDSLDSRGLALVDAIEAALNAERERHYRLLCKWCSDPAYDLRWHHEEWRHYRLRDMHVEYCDAAVLRGKGKTNAD